MVQRYYVGSSGLVKTDNEKDGKWCMYSEYATLAAAARKLVEAVRRRELVYENAAFVESDDEALQSCENVVDAECEWNAALAEVEALLSETPARTHEDYAG